MFRKSLLLSTVFLLIFNLGSYAYDYTYTQQSGTGYFVSTADKVDALEDCNELRTIVNDLGTLLGHSKMDGTYPKDLTIGGTLSIEAITIDIDHTNTLAAGLKCFSLDVIQGTNALTGTLRGAYITASNYNVEATGTIRGLEVKARTEQPGGSGATVAVLEGISISADSKDHSVGIMRGMEVILDGITGGTVTEGVGIRIANNMQADKTTTMIALQIYADSFPYTYGIDMAGCAGLINTADIRLSYGEIIKNTTDGEIEFTGKLKGDGSLLTDIGVETAVAITLNAKEENEGDIVKGQPVYISGAVGAAYPKIGLADADDATKTYVIGLAAEDISQNTIGIIRIEGILEDVDSFGNTAINPDNENWAAGQLLYLHTIIGGLTKFEPTIGRVVEIGHSLYGSNNHDDIHVHIMVTHPHIEVVAGENIILRLGDSGGSNKVIIKDYSNAQVAYIDSDGGADFNSLILDTALAVAEGGTGVTTSAMVNFTSIVNTGIYIGRDGDNQISWATDDRLKIKIGGVEHTILDIETGGSNNDSLVTQGYVDDIAAGANVNLSNLASVAINTSIMSATQDTDSLGTTSKEWLNLYIGDAGNIYLGLAQDVNLQRTASGVLTITAVNGVVTSAGLAIGGILDYNDERATEVKTIEFNGVYAIGNSGATETVDWQNGAYQSITIDEACVISFSNEYVGTLNLRVTYAGSFALTFDGGITLLEEGGVEIVTTDASGVDVLMFKNWGIADTYDMGALIDVKD